MTHDWRPEHRYIPGQTPRHPEDLFDDIRNTVHSCKDLRKCHAMSMGRAFYDDGYYWEAHEVLEAVWLNLGPNSGERYAVQALIQLANGRLKLRMGMPKAAVRLADIAQDLWEKADHSWFSDAWIRQEISDLRHRAS